MILVVVFHSGRLSFFFSRDKALFPTLVLLPGQATD